MASLERLGPVRHDLFVLDEARERISVGKSSANDLVIDDDPAISRVHALLERAGPAWCLTDVGATNGTIVNGERILLTTRLVDCDELLLGRTRLLYRDRDARHEATTERVSGAPDLTKTEKRVLIELCRPVLSGSTFTEPASVAAIAHALYVGEGAVRQHLGRLYDKFGIQSEPGVQSSSPPRERGHPAERSDDARPQARRRLVRRRSSPHVANASHSTDAAASINALVRHSKDSWSETTLESWKRCNPRSPTTRRSRAWNPSDVETRSKHRFENEDSTCLCFYVFLYGYTAVLCAVLSARDAKRPDPLPTWWLGALAAIALVLLVRGAIRAVVVSDRGITIRSLLWTHEIAWSSEPRYLVSRGEDGACTLCLEVRLGRVLKRRVDASTNGVRSLADALEALDPGGSNRSTSLEPPNCVRRHIGGVIAALCVAVIGVAWAEGAYLAPVQDTGSRAGFVIGLTLAAAGVGLAFAALEVARRRSRLRAGTQSSNWWKEL